MKTQLGILGLGEKATQFYIDELNKLRTNCSYKLHKTNFEEINNLLPNTSIKLEKIIWYNINSILKLNVNTLLIPNISLHQTIDNLTIDAVIIHPIKETIKALKQNNYTKVILFGSLYTMQSSYIKNIFRKNNIEVLPPLEKDMISIDDLRKQVYQETETTDLLDNFNLLVKKYAQNNTVVIACTELSLALKNSNKKIFDMARIQIDKAAKMNDSFYLS